MMIRHAVAIAVATSLLAAGKPALADETATSSAPQAAPESANTGASTTRKVFIYSGYGVAAVGLGLSFIFLGQANSAYNSRRDIAVQNGSEQHTAWKCYGADECSRMQGFREDQSGAKTRWAAMIGLSIGGAVAGTTFLIAHLIDSSAESKRAAAVRLTPAVSHQEAGMQLQGTF